MPQTVCIIPARGGSVRIPRKNISPFSGRPMLARAIDKAQACGLFDLIYVSTDDDEIASMAAGAGVRLHYRKPDDGQAGTQQIAGDVLRWLGSPGPSIACVLYPCTPLLTIEELIFGYRLLHAPIPGGPLYVFSASDDKGTDAGGFYWGYTFAFVRGIPLTESSVGMPVQHHRDINTPGDWADSLRRFSELQGKAA